jgi:hypothetical protein
MLNESIVFSAVEVVNQSLMKRKRKGKKRQLEYCAKLEKIECKSFH